MKRTIAFAAFLALCGFASVAHAQVLGGIVGTISDPSGAVVPSANITVTQEGTGLSRSVSSNSQGYYVIPSLSPSVYDLSVQKSGFRTYTQKGVTLLANQTATVNVALEVGQTTQEVTVTGAAPLVNTTTPTVGQVIEQRRMVDLPLNGRNAADLTLLVPGTVTATSDADQGSTKTFPGAVTISTNGSTLNSVSFNLDGANHTDEYTNVNSPFPFPDALQEFSVQTSNYSAQYGGNSGGAVNIVTKSGTNQWHGDGFEFVRNAVFNARNFFEDQRDQLKRNQFGGTVGGPVVIPGLYNGHDRTFFFFGYEGNRIRNVAGGNSAFVPTNAELNGDFSALLDANNPDNPVGQSVQIIDPQTGQPFPGNLIDPTRFDSASLSLLQDLPRASGSGQIFYSTPGVHQDFDQFIARGDHAISSKDQLSARWFYDRFNKTGLFDPSNLLTLDARAKIIYQDAMLHETHTFQPNLLNDFRFSYSRTGAGRGPVPGAPNVGDFGVPIFQPTPAVIDCLSVCGFFGVSQSEKARFVRNDYVWADDINWITGRNSITFGGSFDRSEVDIRNNFLASGTFSFTGDITGFALSDFMLGRMKDFRQGFGEYKENRNNFIGVYFQDQIHATRRLTLNAGFRYEPAWPWREKQGRVTLIRPDDFFAGVKSQIFPNAPAGLFFPGDAGVSPRGTTGDFNNISPRVGFAYDVFGNGKTSVRGGAGTFYDSRQPGIINNQFVDVSPWSPQVTLTEPQGPFSNPLVGVANYPFPFTFPPQSNFVFPTPVLAVSYDPGTGLIIPITYSWNLQIEQQLPHDWLFRAAYVGSRANHLRESTELNPATFIPDSSLGTDDRRRMLGFQSVQIAGQDINSQYNSLQVTAEKRFNTSGTSFLHGLTFLANYTWSRSIDDVPAPGGNDSSGGQNVDIGADQVSALPYGSPFRHQFDRGRSFFDHTNRFVASYVWAMPKFTNSNAFVHHFLGDWQLSGIFTAQTGDPITILAGQDISETGLQADRAVQVGAPKGPGACGDSAPCVNFLNPTAFALPAPGGFGNVGKGSVNGPDLITWDMGFFKDIPLQGSERYRLQFRAEFFNIFNRANFDDPNNTFSGGGFGQILGVSDPRIGQLAMKVFF